MENERLERVARVIWKLRYADDNSITIATAVLAELAGELRDATTNLDAAHDLSILANPRADAWADYFAKVYPGCNVPKDVMLGWFANAMMAMHDFLKGGGPINGDHAQFLQDKAIDEARGEKL